MLSYGVLVAIFYLPWFTTQNKETKFGRQHDMDNIYCDNGLLISISTNSVLRCAKQCALNSDCVSFFYNVDGTCYLHNEQLSLLSACWNWTSTKNYINYDFVFHTKPSSSTTETSKDSTTEDTKSSTTKDTELSTTDTITTSTKSPTTTELTTIPSTTAALSCEVTWLQIGNGCYKFTPPDNTNKIWTDAKNICIGLGGYLVVIETEAENQAVKEYLAANYGQVLIWMGGSDLQTEGVFKWDNTGDVINLPNSGQFEDWFPPNQPDNGAGGTPQNCMAFYGAGSFTWNDVDCSITRRFVCEKDPV